MQTRLADWIRDTPRGREADAVLRKLVREVNFEKKDAASGG